MRHFVFFVRLETAMTGMPWVFLPQQKNEEHGSIVGYLSREHSIFSKRNDFEWHQLTGQNELTELYNNTG